MSSSLQLTSIQQRAIDLLGSGISPEHVALTLGVTPSAISQIVSDPVLAEQIASLRYENLQKHNKRDNEYDSIEDSLIEKLKDLIPLMSRPAEVLKGIQVINAAKRRGTSAPEAITQQNTHVTLIMPTKILQQFTTDINNQVVEVSGQNLLTIQSKTLLDKISPTTKAREIQDDSITEKEVSRITNSA